MQANIVALDLSLTGTGWAALDADGTISTGRITTKATGCQRIASVTTEIATLTDARLIAVEGPSFASNMSYAHELAGLWWHVRMMLWACGAEVVVISPHSVQQYATGKGIGNKPAVLAEAARRFRHLPISSTDEADALWMLAMCAEHYGHPLVDMPAVNRSALHKIVPAKKGKPAHPAIGWPAVTIWEHAHA